MQLGIFAKTFPEVTPHASLQAVSNAGFAAAHFNIACCNIPSMPEHVPHDLGDEIKSAAQENNVPLLGLSATYNIIDPDPQKRARAFRSFEQLAYLAKDLHIPMLSLCSGTCHVSDMWAYHRDNEGKQAWLEMCREIDRLIPIADACGLKLGLEPEHANVVSNASKAAALLKDIQSKTLGIIIDPANLIEKETLKEQHHVVAHAVDTLGFVTVMAHAKDKNLSGQNVVVGTGIIDFSFFMRELRASHFNGPLVTHGLDAQDAPQAANYLKGLMQ